MIRPSSLPALAQCPRFEPGSSEFSDSGSLRHKALKAILLGAMRPAHAVTIPDLPEDELEAVQWAADYILMHAPKLDYPLIVEEANCFVVGNEMYWGTPDVTCGPVLFDMKWRERDYSAQMAAYVLMGEHEEAEVHILYAERQWVDRYKITRQSALDIVRPIIDRAKNPNSEAQRCDYCNWCAIRLQCPAFNAPVMAIAAGREDWGLQQWHCSQITTPEDIAKAVKLAPLARKWADAVDHFALEMWQKQGVAIPGCELKETKGKSYINDMQGAYAASGLSAEEFLSCCVLRSATSKTASDKPGIQDVYAAKQTAMSKATAKREWQKKVAPFTNRGPSSFKVVSSQTKQIEGEE